MAVVKPTSLPQAVASKSQYNDVSLVPVHERKLTPHAAASFMEMEFF